MTGGRCPRFAELDALIAQELAAEQARRAAAAPPKPRKKWTSSGAPRAPHGSLVAEHAERMRARNAKLYGRQRRAAAAAREAHLRRWREAADTAGQQKGQA